MKVNILVLLFIFSFYCVAVANQDQIIAVVNNEAITQSEFKEFLGLMYMDLRTKYDENELNKHEEELSKTALSRLIEDRLILQEAKRQNIEVKDKEVHERFDDIKSRFSSEAEFQGLLVKQGISPSTLKNQLRDQLFMQAIVDKEIHSQINVSPTEVTVYYRGQSQEFTNPPSRRLYSIFVKTKDNADEILGLIKEGKDFSELKEKYNEGPDIGLVTRGQLLKDLEDLIFSLQVGETSNIFKARDGFYIFRLIEELPAQTKKLAEVQDDIFTILTEQKAEKRIKEWLDGLKKKAYIYVK